MKTLFDEVNEIKNARMSNAAKKSALVKLGITPYEIELILNPIEGGEGYNAPARVSTRFTFGVEIECDVMRNAIREASQETGMAYQYEGYNHRDGHDYFKFVTDGSVTGASPIECVSPVLRGRNGQTLLKNACETLNKANARVNKSCGLHVHIGVANFTQKEYANVFNNFYYIESLVDTFMAPSRRANNNIYCRSVRDHSELTNATTVYGVMRCLHNDRYHKINPMSYERHKTIEFRQHQGSTNFEKIYNWVKFCGKFVMWSRTNRLSAPVTNIDDLQFLTAAEKRYFKTRSQSLS